MKKIYAFAASALLAMTAFGASAQEGVTYTLSPATDATYESLPTELVLTATGTVNGVEIASLKKEVLVGNPLKMTNPSAKTQALSRAVYAANTITVPTMNYSNPYNGFDMAEEGEWTITLVKNAFQFVDAAGNVIKTDEGGTIKNDEMTFTYKVGAAAEELVDTYKMTVAPSNEGTFKSFPEELVITIDGSYDGVKIANLKAGFSNLVKIKNPEGTTVQVAYSKYKFDGNTITVPVASLTNFNPNLKGEYTLTLVKNTIYFLDGEKANIKFDGKNTSNSEEMVLVYNVEGEEEENPDPIDDSVKYDIELTQTTPKLIGFDFNVNDRSFETIQFVFNMPQLQLTDAAAVTITGPGYSYTEALKVNMYPATSTNFKALFKQDPVYNGEYTLTIPQGVLGDAAWIADHEKGHANAAVNVKFNVVGGKEYVAGGVETIFNPAVNPGNGKVNSLEKVTMTFPSEVFYAEDTQLKVGYTSDLSATAYQNYGTASIKRISATEVELEFSNALTGKGGYRVTVPEGTFWDATHNENEDAGSINAEQLLDWIYIPAAAEVKILSTEPANDSKVGSLTTGYKVVVNTDNNSAVKLMTLSIEGINLNDDRVAPVYPIEEDDEQSTAKTAEGAPCWVNNGAEIPLEDGWLYTFYVTLYDNNDLECASKEFDVYGDYKVGVMTIDLDADNEIIFNINGVRVNNADQLPAGLYIRNGKKVVVK